MNRSTQHAFEPEEVMAYLDGELEARQAAALASHLEHCAECQAVAAQLRQVSELLLDFQVEPCPGKVSDAVHESISSQDQPGPKAESVSNSMWRLKPVLTWAAALIVVAVILGWIATPNLLRSRMPANQAAEVGRRRMLEQGGVSVDNARAGRAAPSQPLNSQSINGLATLAPGSGSFQAGVGVGVSGGRPNEVDEAEAWSSKGGGVETPQIRGPMVVQTASITILAQNYAQASGQLQPLTAQRGGYVQDMTADTRTGAARSVSATLRVPEKQLEGFLADLRKLGHVEQETRNNQEVTDAYIDLTARLKTARATEQRIIQLLGNRTGKLSDVLEAEQELARIRGEIESMDGQRAHMEHQVSYATVQVQLNEEYREQLNPESYSTGRRLRNSLVEGLGNLTGGITALALFVFAYGPSIVFWLGVLAVPAWFIYRRVRTSRKTPESM